MGALGCDGHVLALVMLADRKLALVHTEVVCTQEADTPAFQSLEPPHEGGLVATTAFPVHQTPGLAINGGPNSQFVGLPR